MARKPKTPSKARTRKAPSYKSFRLSKKIKSTQSRPIPGIVKLFKQSLFLLAHNKKLFFGIIAIHLLLSVVFVKGFDFSSGLPEAKQNIEDVFGGEISEFNLSVILFGFLLSSGSGAASESAGLYQFFLAIIVSLVLIWAIRQVQAGEKISVRQAYYQGVYPLVPFILVLSVISLQLIPLLIGNFLTTTVFANGLAITAPEKIIWILLYVLLALLSLYMIISSIFALYIVTLPNMTPMVALRSARKLVLHRRFSVGLRIIGFPILFFIMLAVILLPLLFIAPVLAALTFIVLTSLGLYLLHSYMYNLYRSLL